MRAVLCILVFHDDKVGRTGGHLRKQNPCISFRLKVHFNMIAHVRHRDDKTFFAEVL